MHIKQSRIDSFMEAVCNTFIGFWVSLGTWVVVAWALEIPMTWSKNLLITGIFTIVSIVRSYILRRIFNGRPIWLTITHRLSPKP